MPAWESLEGSLASGPAAATWGTVEVEVFAVLEDGQVWNRYWDGEGWHPWEPMGGSFRGQPAAAARDADRIDVFAVGTDGELRHRHWNGTEWVPWQEVEGAPRHAAAVACAWASARLDVFVWGPEDSLWYRALTP